MNDMTSAITPKSDQKNAEDFLSGPRTYTIERVEIRAVPEQPVSVFLAGEERPWKPCKSMSRVLVSAWGPDANKYVGRSLTLYRDPKVKWGGLEVGGIRISHMSDIERDMVLALTETRGKRAPFMVKKMNAAPGKAPVTTDTNAAQKWVDDHLGFVRGASDLESLDAVIAGGMKAMTKLSGTNPDLHQTVTDAYNLRRQALTEADPFEGRTDADHGDQHDDSVADDLNDGRGGE